MLFRSYRICYWAYRDTQKTVAKWKEIPENWKEEFLDSEKRLRAYETLVEYYGGQLSLLKSIRDKIDYGDKIIQGMSEVSK